MRLAENVVVADRFRLVRMIGRGGMGSVWQARHLGLDTDCAVKFIEGDLANLGEAHARFEREAKAAAQLRSPHVVQIFDHGVWEHIPYIAMELLDGRDLGKRLGECVDGRLPLPELNKIMLEVSRALTKAHTAGIVHRDLKPDNIFLVRDDDRDVAKVLDFGIAKLAGNSFEGSTTKTGAMLGTPYYMSPEQAQGVKTVDSRSDLWSLAVIVFQCVTGRLPFESDALGDLLVKIIVNPIPVPSHVFPGVPPGFDGWFQKAANRDPAQRYQTAKEFAESLMLVLGQSSVTDVMDKAQMRAAMLRGQAQTAFMSNAQVPPASSLARSANAPANTTPNPAGHSQPQIIAAFGAVTPNPAMGFGTPNPAAGMVAAPGTFGGADVPQIPKNGAGAGAIIGAVAAVAILIGVGVGVFVLKSRSPAQPTTTATSAVPPHESAMPPAPPPAVSLSETAPSSVVGATSADPSASAAQTPDGPAHVAQGGGGGHAKSAGNNAKPPVPVGQGGPAGGTPQQPQAPAKPPAGKPAPGDLGF